MKGIAARGLIVMGIFTENGVRMTHMAASGDAFLYGAYLTGNVLMYSQNV